MSLYPMSKDIQTLLHAKKFPLTVHYGPERLHREGYPENVIVFERDHEGTDSLGPPRGSQRNVRKLRTRGLASVAHVYAKNSKASAHIGDHHELCEKFVDALLAAIVKWATGARAEGLAITESRYLTAEERKTLAAKHVPGAKPEAVEQWPGVVYQIKFMLPRALFDLDYSGAGLPEAELEGFASSTEVHGPGGAGDGDLGCGS